MKNSIEKDILIKAPIDKVWHAIADHKEFGTWFRVKIDEPFSPGKPSTGHITYPGYEHVKWRAEIKEMIPNEKFSFTWHPYAVDPDRDYSHEPQTLVEFMLREKEGGTHLYITESGFAALPEERFSDAIRMNEDGWEGQIVNIQQHVE